MKASAVIILVLALATSILARPPNDIDSDEYVDNNVIDSIPAVEHDIHNYDEEERAEYVEM